MIKDAIDAFVIAIKKIEPNVKYAPGSPFYEFERLPGIVLEGPTIAEDRMMDYSKVPQFTKMGDKFSKIPGPKHYNLDFSIIAIANRQQELTRMIVGVTAYVTTIIDLVFPVIKPKYSCYMRILNGFAASGSANISGTCEAKATIRIESVPMLSRRTAETRSSIKVIDISIGDNEQEGSVIDGTRVK